MADGVETEVSLYEHAASVLVVVEGVSAGFGVRDGRSLRFRALDPRFEILNDSRFARAEQLRSAALRVARAARDQVICDNGG